MTHMKKNILVVDDSALMRRVMCDIINSDSKFQATDYCRDGLEAYEKLKHTSYDGVVLDVNMPRMDGLQLLEKLQKEGIRATFARMPSFCNFSSNCSPSMRGIFTSRTTPS